MSSLLDRGGRGQKWAGPKVGRVKRGRGQNLVESKVGVMETRSSFVHFLGVFDLYLVFVPSIRFIPSDR
jgi:hypothetical protein